MYDPLPADYITTLWNMKRQPKKSAEAYLHSQQSVLSQELSESMNRAHNFAPVHSLWSPVPDQEESARVHLQPVHARVHSFTSTSFREITIPGVKEGEEYALAFSLPQPLPIPRTNIDAGDDGICLGGCTAHCN